MKRTALVGASLAAILLAACSGGGGGGGSGAAQRQPGMWESTSKITQLQLTGAPPEMQARANAQVGQSQNSRECLTPEQARDPMGQMRRIMARQGPTANCTFSDQVFAGGVVRIRGTCPAAGGGSAQIALEGTFTETTMNVTMNVNAQGPASAQMPGVTGMRISAETSARRTGECPGSGTQ
ncbi:MAG TPA: DUF3617 domain-containing protein [Allosphingosinicella sp.]|nr:DUF3617 domain-containing protein [Allosphingosinicella sp.]